MTRFQLWRDGLLLAVVIVGAGLYGLSTFGFETGWILESRNGVAAVKDAVDLRFYQPSSSGGPALMVLRTERHRGRFTLRTACGDYEGRYGRLLGRIQIDEPRYGGDCQIPDADLLLGLRRADHYRLGDAQLSLTSPQGDVLLFRRAEWPLGLAPARHRITGN
jgi:hypothetical protein